MQPISSQGHVHLILVDPDPASRHATLAWLDGKAPFQVAGAFDSAASALYRIRQDGNGVLVTDLPLPGEDVVHFLSDLRTRHPALRIVVRAATQDLELIIHALEAGASGCVFKSDPLPQLLDAMIDHEQGGHPLSPRVSRSIVEFHNRRGASRRDEAHLSQRELDVLKHLVKGLRSKEIGVALGISMDTVNTHVRHIYEKLGVSSRAQATVWYLEHRPPHG